MCLLALLAALAGTAAYSDIRFRTIPNGLNGATALLGLASVGLTQGGAAAAWALAHLAVALILGMLAFSLRLWGGGDAKFYAAAAAWFPLRQFPLLIIAISLAGLALLIVWFAIGRIGRSHRPSELKKELPYGVAIAAGALVTMALAGLPQS